jgi:RNA polymerase sigma-70 factor (ECF subfamily)
MDFDQVYKEFSPGIYRVCMGYVNDEDLAKDLMQETFIAVWQHQENFRHEAKLSTWIYRIATNHCLRAMENHTRKSTQPLPEEISMPAQDNMEEKSRALYDCIATLEEPERILISLLLEGLPQEEIAEITGISYANTRVRIHRIKEKLTKKMKAYGLHG